MMTKYEALKMAIEWIEWNGGDMPIDGETLVKVKLRSGLIYHGTNIKAKNLCWNHSIEHLDYDIIAYSVIKEQA